MGRGLRIFIWVLNITVGLGLLIYLTGPVLFASVAYPLPDKYRYYVAKYAQENNISPNLLSALIMVESGWRENAHSGAGALGMTQFLPSTAIAMAHRLGITPFSPNDLIAKPQIAIQMGAVYVRDGINTYGSVDFALIRYNGGGGAVNAYKAGFPISSTVAYAHKIDGVKAAYDKIYGSWWQGVDISSPTTPATTPQFTVEPKRDLGIINTIPLSEFWKTILFQRNGTDQSASPDLNNFWQNLLPGG